MSAISRPSPNDPLREAILPAGHVERHDQDEDALWNVSAVSWGAIFAGAAGAAALSLILLILGTGLGLSSVSPWTRSGVDAATFGVSAILWITFAQVVAAGLGGYLAGRLRTKWRGVHTDEAYFRDTVHGFLAWAVASLATAALLVSVIGSILGAGVQAGASAAGTVASAATAGASTAAVQVTRNDVANPNADAIPQPMGYFVDSLFRADPALASDASAPQPPPPAREVARIFANGADTLPQEDLRYLGRLVAQRTGSSQEEAEARVADTYANLQTKLRDAAEAAKSAADTARKGSAHVALWLFISLLLGAFVASFLATYGGRQRDAI